MRKLIVHADTSKSIGCDAYIALGVDDDASEDEINSMANEIAMEHIGGYFDIVDPNDVEDSDEYDEYDDSVCMLDEVESCWEDYDAEKHDMLRSGGGSFEEDFAIM